ncbi:MAG: glycosyltransferase family 2 protein [Prevotella buccalis]|nr:glycosyltransferase family 2 protein [Hoylesella buccalis]
MTQDLVSVIIPCYNATNFLRACVESVLRQTYQNLEILIIDDCSTQVEPRQVLCGLELSDSRIKIFYLNKNSGPAVARNKGIAHAHDYIAFCDSDDM